MWILSIALSVCGAWLAEKIGWPLPWLIGPLLVMMTMRCAFGVLCLTRGGCDRTTAFFASLPGGASEMVNMALKHGARVDQVAAAHSLRIVSIVLLVPPTFTLMLPASAAATVQPVLIPQLLTVLVLGALTAVVWRYFKQPNPWMLGPLLFAAVYVATTKTYMSVPPELAKVAQLFIGLSLGSYFDRAFIRSALPFLSWVSVFIFLSIIFCWVLAWGLAWSSQIPTSALILGMTPGGITELSITAEALGVPVALVTAAITAAEKGKQVLLVEHAPRLLRGGNSQHTRNFRCMHEGPKGILEGTYSEEEYYEDLLRVTEGNTTPELAKIVIRNTPKAYDWMEDHGVRFQPSLGGTLSLSRTNAFFLGGGRALINAYYDTAEALGVSIAYDTEAVELEIQNGVFEHAVVLYKGIRYEVYAKQLIIASGGFESNLEWLEEAWGPAARNFLIRGTQFNRGRRFLA